MFYLYAKNWKSWLCLFLLIILSFGAKAQNCQIVIYSDSGCVPHPVSFEIKAPAGKTVKNVDWDFGDTKVSKEKEPTHVYNDRGVYKVSALVTFTDNSTCQVTSQRQVKIFDNPVVAHNLKSYYKKCWNDKKIDFESKSTPGLDNSPIISTTWDIGNGDILSKPKFSYDYRSEGTYQVKLEIKDANGCKNESSFSIDFSIYEELDLKYIKYGKDSCPLTLIKYINKTDSTDWDVNEIIWDLGNGKIEKTLKSDPNWSDAWQSSVGEYRKNQIYNPSLTVKNKNGCAVYLQKFDISNVFFVFNPSVSREDACIRENNNEVPIIFSQAPIPRANYVSWNFGEPSSPTNTDNDNFTAGHIYTYPGTYTARLTVGVGGCRRDTVLCEAVVIKGPLARINKSFEENDYSKRHRFHPNTFPAHFDTCFNDSFEYYTIGKKPIQRYRNTYCGATKKDSTAEQLLKKCKGTYKRYKYSLNPTTSTPYMGTAYTRIRNVWKKGMPLPKEPVYSSYTGNRENRNLHDTLKYSCELPHTIKFPNNSIKYRGYNAIDDYGDLYPDSCLNPSFPDGSDSIRYVWDFKEGENDTSTSSKPNPYARYSTEVSPTHTFRLQGCYLIYLDAFDRKTGCTSRDSTFIILHAPSSSWDKVAYDTVKRMNYKKQMEIGENSYRRGFMVTGPSCVGDLQYGDISELLPACGSQNVWIIHDSAAQSNYGFCDGKKIDIHTWKKGISDPLKPTILSYKTPGWKTVGIVTKVGNCYDTAWYHKYKYIYNADPEFNLTSYNFCPGDSVGIQLYDTLQEGIERVVFRISHRASDSENWEFEYKDSLDYIILNTKKGSVKATSTLHNPEVKIDDLVHYNNLSQQIYYKLSEIGWYNIETTIYHRFGCSYTSEQDVAVGHKAHLNSNFKTVCVGDKVQFYDSVLYYISTSNTNFSSGFDTLQYWNDPIKMRNGIIPRFPEKISWDFDEDGVIDATGSNPVFKYEKPGIYDVTVYTKDSMNCDEITTLFKDYITVYELKADFKVAKDDSVRFCAKQLFNFQDKTIIKADSDTVKNEIRYWNWRWGDGYEALKSSLPGGVVGHIYDHNGTYDVWLKVYTNTYSKTKGKGCIDSVMRQVRILGPEPEFELIGDSVGCVPFMTTVKNTSKRAKLFEWRLGDNRIKSTFKDNHVSFTYPEPGVYCIEVYGGDSLIDFNGDTLYCVDYFPHKPCAIKVRAIGKNPLTISHDSVLCLFEKDSFYIKDIDSAYSTFILDFNKGGDLINTKDNALENSFGEKRNFPILLTGEGAPCPDTFYSEVNIIGVNADFKLDSSRIDTPYFNFINTSKEGESYDWKINGELFKSYGKEDFPVEFHRTGAHEICIISVNKRGCTDTICKWIEIETNIWVPNIFSANGDRSNDKFRIQIKGELSYKLLIYNRWGERIFESDNADYLWNGRKFNTKENCLPGTYFYLFEYQLIGESPKQKHGTITLVR